MLSYLKIKGTPFEAGAALGRFGAQAVQQYLKNTESWASVMRWRGSERVQAMAGLVQSRHPEYWLELQGLAACLEMPLEDMFLWNCRGDLWAMSVDGCTTVQLPGAEYPSFAHNEDGDPGFVGQCAVAEIAVNGSGRFASFVYPGSLPGHTFAVTDAGLAMTVNNLRALHVDVGLPRMVLVRSMLNLPDVQSAVRYLQESRRSGGFHLTLAQSGSTELLSVEFSANLCSVVKLEKPSLHANHMIHPAMANQPQIITGSSGFRQIRGDELLGQGAASKAAPNPLDVLFDQGNAQFPIYRNDPRDSDNENTLASASIQVRADCIEWQVHVERSTRPLFCMTNGARL